MARYIDDRPYNITQHQLQLAEEIAFNRKIGYFPIQTHENKVACITKDDIGTNIDTLTDALHGIDAMYTFDSNVLLTMCYADCVPVYFIVQNIILLHWRMQGGEVPTLKL